MKTFELKEIEILDAEKYEGFLLGDPIVPETLEEYEFPTYASFFGQIKVDSDKYLYIFFDLEEFYMGKFNEEAINVMGYLTLDEPKTYLDDFNEAHDEEMEEFKKCFALIESNKKDIEINDNCIIISNEANPGLFNLFLNFSDDIKYVKIDYNLNVNLNEFTKLKIKFIK